MKKKIIIAACIVVVLIGTILILTASKNGKNGNGLYKTEAIKKGDIEALVITTGTLNPVTLVDVGSQVSGKIEKLYVDFNSKVEEEQVIAQIEQSLFLTRVKQNEANYESSKATVEKAKVTLANSKNKFDRAKDLFEKELISFEEYETSEAQYYSAEADLVSAEAKLEQANSQLDSSQVDLEHTVIRSPIEGFVVNRNVNMGQTVAASFQAPVLFQIANDLAKMQVECSIDEADIGKVAEGQNVRFTVDAFPDEEFKGIVQQVRYAPEVVQNVVTYTTVVKVENPELKLRPGMTATVSVIVGKAENTLRIPNTALRFTPDLSPEEMKQLFERMRAERGGSGEEQGAASSKPNPKSGQSFASQQGMPSPGGSGMFGAQGRNMSRVWIVRDGELHVVPLKTGVTDNSYTELVWGNLEEGQEVIIGENPGQGSDRRRGGMMFMRR
jgi:HlyD family secretion protein